MSLIYDIKPHLEQIIKMGLNNINRQTTIPEVKEQYKLNRIIDLRDKPINNDWTIIDEASDMKDEMWHLIIKTQ